MSATKQNENKIHAKFKVARFIMLIAALTRQRTTRNVYLFCPSQAINTSAKSLLACVCVCEYFADLRFLQLCLLFDFLSRKFLVFSFCFLLFAFILLFINECVDGLSLDKQPLEIA